MKYLNKLTTFCCAMALALPALTGCEGGDLYDVNAPDWLSEKINEIANSKENEDNSYMIGDADYSTGWWSAFSEYYTIPLGGKWEAVFNLHINPKATNTYKNFALVITNDVDRDGDGYKEYGAIRFDNQPTGNSEWGTYIDRDYVESTLTFETDTDAGIEKLGGEVTLTVDRTSMKEFNVTITNGTVTKTYKQPSALVNLNASADNTDIRCFLAVEGSYIEFLRSTIERNDLTDSEPVSMELQGVPAYVTVDTPLETIVKDVTAVVTFAEGGTTTVSADELVFKTIPEDLTTTGKKTLIAMYNKTFLGKNCDQPIMASATFDVEEKITSIEVTKQPSNVKYYYYTSDATKGMTDRTLAFDPTGMVVEATYADGSKKALDHAKLSFSTLSAKTGTQAVTITATGGITAKVNVTIAESTVSKVSNSTAKLGEDTTTIWWSIFSDDFNVPKGETKAISFTNYSSMANNWNNYCVILRKTDIKIEYAVLRSDNWGWGDGYAACTHEGTQGDWATWLASMNGAKVTVYVTNCGNGTADVQTVINGNTGSTSTQYYLGINTVDVADLNFALTVDGSYLVFDGK